MRGQNYNQDEPEVIPFARPDGQPRQGGNQVDQVGQAMLELVSRVAETVESNRRQTMERAQKLSNQLRAAEDTIRHLEGEIALVRQRADHAEQWLHRVYTEIEDRFLKTETRRATAH
jgi:ribosome-binding protein aMBF1 (putative translation factor)